MQPAQSQAPLTAGQLELLVAIKSKARGYLVEIPNYTCIETIERTIRRPPRREFDSVDVLRLEVAVVEGKEMFAWPGETSFQDRDLREMVGGGAIGTGSFALHARALFLTSAPRFHFGTFENMGARNAVRFDFEVSLTQSGFKLKVPPEEAEVAYYGSFWAEVETHNLLRIKVEATEIPARLRLSRVTEIMDYQMVPIAGGEFLLPRESELTMVGVEGGESHNRIRFSRCRQYSGESKISFAEAPADTASGGGAESETITIPDGTDLTLELESEIDGETAAAGDPITAKLLNSPKVQGRTIFPKGSQARGRIVRLERYSRPTEYWVLGLRFDSLTHGNRQARISAWLQSTSPVRAIVFPPNEFYRSRQVLRQIPFQEPPPGVGYLYWTGSALRTPRGLRTYWRTQTRPAKESASQ